MEEVAREQQRKKKRDRRRTHATISTRRAHVKVLISGGNEYLLLHLCADSGDSPNSLAGFLRVYHGKKETRKFSFFLYLFIATFLLMRGSFGKIIWRETKQHARLI